MKPNQNLPLNLSSIAIVLTLFGCAVSDPGLRAAINDVQSRPEMARKALRPYAENGDARAIAHICIAYGRSIDSAVRGAEREQAFVWCQQAAGAGNAEAQFYLGRFFHWGIGVTEDRVAALRWYTEAASRGHVEAEDARRGLEGKSAVCKNWVTGCRLM